MTIEDIFEKQGGTFLSSAKEIAVKLEKIKGFIFDWDGVFNNGVKAELKGSPFSEPDSMGLNMLRFSYWLKYRKLPIVAIITGENNTTALDFAKREHLNAVYLNSKNKKETLNEIAHIYSLSTKEIAFIFDDILDLSAVDNCSLSFCVRRNASPLFQIFISDNKLCDYITGQEGGKHAVREITELINGLQGNYSQTVTKRMNYGGAYQQYLSFRNAINVEIKNSFQIE